MNTIPPLAFLDAVAGYTRQQSHSSADRPIRLATIDPAYNGFPEPYPQPVPPARVTFAGEDTLSGKEYPVANGFVPHPSDRVWMVPIGTSYLIVGRVGPQTPQGFWQDLTGDDSGVEFGGGSYFDTTTGLYVTTDATILGDLDVRGAGRVIDKYKTSTTQRTSTTATSADPELSADLTAGMWEVEMFLFVGGTDGDLKTRWSVTGTVSGTASRMCIGPSPFTVDTSTEDETVSREAAPMRISVHNYATEAAYGMNSLTFYYAVVERGLVNLTTAGNVTLSWAQAASSANASAVAAYSHMRCRKVA